jgi:hypothetical protein
MKFDKLTIKAQGIGRGADLAQEGQNQVVDIPHVLTALLSEGIPTDTRSSAEHGHIAIAQRGGSRGAGESEQVYLSRELSKAFKTAKEAVAGDEYISTEHLLRYRGRRDRGAQERIQEVRYYEDSIPVR